MERDIIHYREGERLPSSRQSKENILTDGYQEKRIGVPRETVKAVDFRNHEARKLKPWKNGTFRVEIGKSKVNWHSGIQERGRKREILNKRAQILFPAKGCRVMKYAHNRASTRVTTEDETTNLLTISMVRSSRKLLLICVHDYVILVPRSRQVS